MFKFVDLKMRKLGVRPSPPPPPGSALPRKPKYNAQPPPLSTA